MGLFVKVVICLFFVLILIAPWLFTQPAVCDSLVFESTGQIGDTIGGCTAPVIGIISILLLFYTLKSQLEFNRIQTNLLRDEQFKSTFFQLLHQQRDILSSLNERFEVLKRGTVKKEVYEASGQNFFNRSLYQLDMFFHVLESSTIYKSRITKEEEDAILEQLSQDVIYSSNLPNDIKKDNERLIRQVGNLMWLNFFVEKFKISEDEFIRYKDCFDVNKKIQFVYGKFIQVYFKNGYYFRHLYRMLKYVEDTETVEIASNPKNKEAIQRKYLEYAQFIQAQMSTGEMLMVFYNCSVFPKAKDLLIKYNILENLYIENLLLPEHRSLGYELNLSHRPQGDFL